MQHEPAFPDDKFKVAAGSPLPVRLALTPDSERPAILTGTDPVSVFLSCLEPPPLYLLAHPRLGGGWRAKRDGRGRLPQEAIKMAPHTSKGRLPPFTIFSGPFHHYRGPPPPDKQGEARLRRKKPRHYAYLPTPILGVGGERSEPEGGGYIKWRPNISKGRLPPFTIYHLPF